MTKAKAPNERGLRDKIIEATVELVSEAGIQSITHRVVAQRAGASLGSTTYHFKTLDDLIAAALERSTDQYAGYLASWAERHTGLPVEQLTTAVARSVWEQCTGTNRNQAIVAEELHTAALRRPAVQLAANRSADATHGLLATLFGDHAARFLSPLLAGVTNQLLLDQDSYSPARIEELMRVALVATPVEE